MKCVKDCLLFFPNAIKILNREMIYKSCSHGFSVIIIREDHTEIKNDETNRMDEVLAWLF